MPYLTAERKEYLKGSWDKGITGGDINFLFTELILEKWKSSPRYQTIHDIFLAVRQPACEEKFWNLRADLMEHGVSAIDVQVGAELAFQEFYRRIASELEDFKASTNGDVYEEAINNLFEQLGQAGSQRRGA